MHFKRNNMEILIGTETAEIIEKHFEYLLQKYQKDLEESMKGMFLIALIYCITNFIK